MLGRAPLESGNSRNVYVPGKLIWSEPGRRAVAWRQLERLGKVFNSRRGRYSDVNGRAMENVERPLTGQDYRSSRGPDIRRIAFCCPVDTGRGLPVTVLGLGLFASAGSVLLTFIREKATALGQAT